VTSGSRRSTFSRGGIRRPQRRCQVGDEFHFAARRGLGLAVGTHAARQILWLHRSTNLSIRLQRLWEYRPDFSKPAWRAGADAARAVVSGDDGVRAATARRARLSGPSVRPMCWSAASSRSKATALRLRFRGTAKLGKKPAPISDKFFRPSARLVIPINCAAASGAMRGSASWPL